MPYALFPSMYSVTPSLLTQLQRLPFPRRLQRAFYHIGIAAFVQVV